MHLLSWQSSILVLCALIGLGPGLAVHAEEGGAGHYVPGGFATLIDLPSTKPGWAINPLYLHYNGDASASRTFPVAGLIAGGIEATIDAFTLGATYTFDQQLFGAHYSIGLYVPYVWMDVEATLTTLLGAVRRSDSVDGLGDLTLYPLMMAWKVDAWQFNALLAIYAPTGDYDAGRLANTGLNYWTFEPTAGFSYNNEEIGFNFATHAGVTINTENNDTNYRSGSVLHVDVSIQQLLPLGKGFLGIGANGFIYEQFTGDSGSGAGFGDFEGRTMGVGPVLSYILPVGDNTFVAEASWLPELETKNRIKGELMWVKLVWQF